MGKFISGLFAALIVLGIALVLALLSASSHPSNRALSQVNERVTSIADYRLSVRESGLYQVTAADMKNAGLPVEQLDPRGLRLYNQGQEVAIYIDGEEDGAMDAGDFLLFYGQQTESRYSRENIYWLSWEDSPGLRMPVQSDLPAAGASQPEYHLARQRFEQNKLYLSNHPSGTDQDRWYWSSLLVADTSQAQGFDFELANLSVSPHLDVTLRGAVIGLGSPDAFRTRLYLNDHLVEERAWPAERSGIQAEYTFEVIAPQAYLQDGRNVLTIEGLPGGEKRYWRLSLNWFEIEYFANFQAQDDLAEFRTEAAAPQQFVVSGFDAQDVAVFDISSPLVPNRVTAVQIEPDGGQGGYRLRWGKNDPQPAHYMALSPGRYLQPVQIEADRPSRLHAADNQADYVVITHADFYQAVQPLVEYRARQGLKTILVDVQDIYDEFSGGMLTPQAIQDFLAYTYQHWAAPAPQYVLLVGDGHYDFLNDTQSTERNFIPPYMADFDPSLGESAADNRYVSFSQQDNLPEMSIGRLPVHTADQTTRLVKRIIAYEQGTANRDWPRQVLFIADNADMAGNFQADSDAITASSALAGYQNEKFYYDPASSNPAQASAAIIERLSAGYLFVNYLGHGTVNFWGAEPLLSSRQLERLPDAERYPIVMMMSCLNGYFIEPGSFSDGKASLAEQMLLSESGGAIAVWGATGMGLETGQKTLLEEFYRVLLQKQDWRLGSAFLQAKYALAAGSSNYPDLIDSFTLLGDPALQLNLPDASSTNK